MRKHSARTIQRQLSIEDVTAPSPIRTQSFAHAFPEAAVLWSYKKNCGFGPEDFSYGSNVKCWFKCPEGPDHFFQISLKNMSKSARDETWNMGCGFCHGKKLSVTNSLAEKYPHIAKEWMVKRNRLRPDQVTYGSTKIVWWKCSKGHEWKAHVNSRTQINSRTQRNSGCAICNRGAPIDLRKYPNALKEFDSKRNKGIDPKALPVAKKVFWVCSVKAGHRWQARFSRTTNGIRCPYCTNKKGSRENNLKQSHPEVAKLWHPDKNDLAKPTDITATSHLRVWWKCLKGPDHEWQSAVRDRVKAKYLCPFCSFQRTSVTNIISAVAPHLVKEWHRRKNGKARPDNKRAHSIMLRWWRCTKCYCDDRGFTHPERSI